jgi:IstB-like ATP binding protein
VPYGPELPTYRGFLAEPRPRWRATGTEREEKNSMAIASNENFSGWTKTFTDPTLCAAIVDRLTFGGNIIETGTDSYRLAQTRARAGHATS